MDTCLEKDIKKEDVKILEKLKEDANKALSGLESYKGLKNKQNALRTWKINYLRSVQIFVLEFTKNYEKWLNETIEILEEWKKYKKNINKEVKKLYNEIIENSKNYEKNYDNMSDDHFVPIVWPIRKIPDPSPSLLNKNKKVADFVLDFTNLKLKHEIIIPNFVFIPVQLDGFILNKNYDI